MRGATGGWSLSKGACAVGASALPCCLLRVRTCGASSPRGTGVEQWPGSSWSHLSSRGCALGRVPGTACLPAGLWRGQSLCVLWGSRCTR